MQVSHPEVQLIINECENRIRELTKNDSIVLVPFDRKKRKRISFKQIVTAVCEVTNVPYEMVKARTRKGEAVVARQLIFFYAKRYSNMSHRIIGEQLGGRDHSASIHSIQKINDLIDAKDSVICEAIEKIDQHLKLML